MDALPADQIPVLIDTVSVIRLTRYAQISATCFAVYDHFLNFDQEYRLIWLKPWSYTKCFYLWARYFSTFTVIIDTLCLAWLIFQGWITCIVFWTWQVILQARVWALYKCSKRLLYFIVPLFIIEIIAMTAILADQNFNLQVSGELFPGIRACVTLKIQRYFFAFWIPTLLFESTLLTLVIVAAARSIYQTRNLDMTRLINVLIRDNILYFVVLFTVYLANAIVWFTQPSSHFEVPEGFTTSLTCTMGSRLMLNLRDVYYRTQATGGDGTALTLPSSRMPGHPSYHTRTIGSAGRPYPPSRPRPPFGRLGRAPNNQSLDVYEDPTVTKGFTQTILETFGNFESVEGTVGEDDHLDLDRELERGRDGEHEFERSMSASEGVESIRWNPPRYVENHELVEL